MNAYTFCSLSKKQMVAKKKKLLPTEEVKNGVEGYEWKSDFSVHRIRIDIIY